MERIAQLKHLEVEKTRALCKLNIKVQVKSKFVINQ